MLTFERFYGEYPSPFISGFTPIYARLVAISKFLIGLCLLIASVTCISSAAQGQDGQQEITLVALGDSLTAGYGLAPADGFTPKLETYLRAQGLAVRVVNGGVSGDTSSGGLARFDWVVPDEADAIIIELGANDALRGINPDVTRANLTQIIEKSRERGLAILLAGMLAPPNLGPAYGKRFAAIYPDLASTYGVAFYPFFLDGVAAQKSLNLSDRIHPNAAGIDVIIARIGPYAESLVSSVISRKESK